MNLLYKSKDYFPLAVRTLMSVSAPSFKCESKPETLNKSTSWGILIFKKLSKSFAENVLQKYCYLETS